MLISDVVRPRVNQFGRRLLLDGTDGDDASKLTPRNLFPRGRRGPVRGPGRHLAATSPPIELKRSKI